MKIICAGLSKTGTKSLNAALKLLGFNVYDCYENFEIFGEQWEKIYQSDGNIINLLRDMYENIDAVCDLPIYSYWEDLLQAFPNAKVILMIRNTQDDWFNSLVTQLRKNDSYTASVLINLLSKTTRRYVRFNMTGVWPVFGRTDFSIFQGPLHLNEFRMKQEYRKHIAYTKQCCPEKQLLVFNCRDGWEPLCKFLELPIPKQPFPHKNINGTTVDDDFLPSKTYQSIKRDIMLMTIIIPSTIALLVLGIIRMYVAGN